MWRPMITMFFLILVTARAAGGTKDATVILQAEYDYTPL